MIFLCHNMIEQPPNTRTKESVFNTVIAEMKSICNGTSISLVLLLIDHRFQIKMTDYAIDPAGSGPLLRKDASSSNERSPCISTLSSSSLCIEASRNKQ